MTVAVHECTGCGARIVFEGPALSGRCSYCDSPMVDGARVDAGGFDAIVPFRVPERAALERLQAHLHARRSWVPAALRTVRLHQRSLRGVLVPFWVYEGVLRSDYRAKVGLYWYRSETYVDREGKTQTKQVRETEWQSLHGTAVRQVEDHAVSASVGLPEREAVALGRFDLGWSTSYDPRVLSGFEAELPTIADADARQTALEELREAEAARLQRELLPGDVNRIDAISSRIELAGRRLVLLPVWILVHRHGDHVLRLLVNGQTGTVAGRVPLSKAKIAAVVVAVLLLVGLIALLVWWGGRP